LAAAFLISSVVASSAWAHCDGLDGPVVQAARRALETGNANHALIWVKHAAEAEIKQAFQKALAVRKLSPEAKELADRHFLETIVRIHRQGEGAGYTGLKPAGRDLGPAVPAADKAIESGSVDAVAKLLTESVLHSLRERFAETMEKKKFKPDDVAKGQEYVEAYVSFIHFVERIHEAATEKAPGHHPEH
jgi:DNA-binding FadR family transcriptional regulator